MFISIQGCVGPNTRVRFVCERKVENNLGNDCSSPIQPVSVRPSPPPTIDITIPPPTLTVEPIQPIIIQEGFVLLNRIEVINNCTFYDFKSRRSCYCNYPYPTFASSSPNMQDVDTESYHLVFDASSNSMHFNLASNRTR